MKLLCYRCSHMSHGFFIKSVIQILQNTSSWTFVPSPWSCCSELCVDVDLREESSEKSKTFIYDDVLTLDKNNDDFFSSKINVKKLKKLEKKYIKWVKDKYNYKLSTNKKLNFYVKNDMYAPSKEYFKISFYIKSTQCKEKYYKV